VLAAALKRTSGASMLAKRTLEDGHASRRQSVCSTVFAGRRGERSAVPANLVKGYDVTRFERSPSERSRMH
jgi:hypothetical protein